MYFCGWVQRNRRFAFLVKADDDAFVWLSPLRDTLLRLWQDTAPAGLGTGPSGTPEGRPRRVYYGHIWTGPPIRDPRQKNFLPAERYPLPLYSPYAHGAAYALSADFVNFVVQNHVLLSDGLLGNCAHCGAHEDSQIGLWLHGLGARPQHEPRFSDLTHCHARSIALFDVPEALLPEIDAAARAAEAAAATAQAAADGSQEEVAAGGMVMANVGNGQMLCTRGVRLAAIAEYQVRAPLSTLPPNAFTSAHVHAPVVLVRLSSLAHLQTVLFAFLLCTALLCMDFAAPAARGCEPV